MKQILRQYLADLRERDELDAILPALLSEAGFNVISKPSRGTRQMGVDVAAVGNDPDDSNRRKLFLFVVKRGDIRRADWDSGAQSVRPSLEEIQDSYIPHRIPEQFSQLPIAVCVCMGGDLGEEVQDNWAGYVAARTTESLCFRVWNGDTLAHLLETGALRGELVDRDVRGDFERSVAMVGHPDVSLRFFQKLTDGLLAQPFADGDGVSKLRQLYVCLWILYVWGRSSENLDAPYRASEYALLRMWGFCKASALAGTLGDAAMDVLHHTIAVHLAIGEELLGMKVAAYVSRPFALSAAVASHSPVDVNLALFELLGRVSLAGLWRHWQSSGRGSEAEEAARDRDAFLNMAIAMVNSNTSLRSPIRDDFAIEIALFMRLALACDAVEKVGAHIVTVACRVMYSVLRGGVYPTTVTEYTELAEHPAESSDGYFKENTRGSVLYPLLVAWLNRLGETEVRDALVSMIDRRLAHTTQQVWVPDDDTDDRLWEGRRDHGVGIPGVPLCQDRERYDAFLERVRSDHNALDTMSTTELGTWPMFLLACRHFRLPLPPQLWFDEV